MRQMPMRQREELFRPHETAIASINQGREGRLDGHVSFRAHSDRQR